MEKGLTADKVAAEMGLEEGNHNSPFIEFKGKENIGKFFFGEVQPGREVTYIPKKGKNKGKKQTSTYYPVVVEQTDMKAVEEGKAYTISATGLLNYQFTDGAKEKGHNLPSKVMVIYKGLDDEGRHQTEVRWPKA